MLYCQRDGVWRSLSARNFGGLQPRILFSPNTALPKCLHQVAMKDKTTQRFFDVQGFVFTRWRKKGVCPAGEKPAGQG